MRQQGELFSLWTAHITIANIWIKNCKRIKKEDIFNGKVENKKENHIFGPLWVAGEGIEPPAFGLWAQRATTAPPRDAVFKTDAKVRLFFETANFLPKKMR